MEKPDRAKLDRLSSKDLRTAIESAIEASPEFGAVMSAAVDAALEQQRHRRQQRKLEVSLSDRAPLTPLYSMIFDEVKRRAIIAPYATLSNERRWLC